MLPKICTIAWTVVLAGACQGVASGSASLFQQNTFSDSRNSLFPARHSVEIPVQRRSGSLFAGQQGTSFFAPLPEKPQHPRLLGKPNGSQSQVERIRHLIAQAEAGKHGYNAVQLGAKIRPGKPPTQMTLGEIYTWIKQTPGQQHAIGRYQFIPSTLKRLARLIGAGEAEVFNAALQDRLADVLLAEAGLNALYGGEMARHTFMNNLAKIWAGLPTSSGHSYYHGYAGNKATMSWAYFDAEMGKIFPSDPA